MDMRIYTFIIILLTTTTGYAQIGIGKKTTIDPYRYTIQKDFTGKNGAVVCAHPLAAQVGLDILKQGGNAIDAAIATQLALAVVYPGAGNLGGGGFMVAHLSTGQSLAMDFREMAPAHATRNMYVDTITNKVIPGLSEIGHLSTGVPGTVAGLFASMKYAKLPFSKLIQPAIQLAEHGFSITQREADNLNNNMQYLRKANTVANVFTQKEHWKGGDTLIQKDLAQTLIRIRDNGAAGFYEGETAQLITDEMQRGNGIVTMADLKAYKVHEREPIVFDYKGYTIITMPPPSSGGVLLQQMLKMLEDRPIKEYGYTTTKSVQLITEVERRAYADRAEYLGDPDFYKVPAQKLVSAHYIAQRMDDYDSLHAGISNNVHAGIFKESNETTHLSIMDKDGNCVSITTTLNGHYGCYVVTGRAGFFLNNEMDDFSAQAGVPNMYGAVGGDANCIAPGKRMLSSMTPTIILKDGKPFMVTGTPGGTSIITSVLQSILDVIDYNMSVHDIATKPKFHHQWLPDRIDVEQGFPQDVCEQLKAMGYTINRGKIWGRLELIKVTGKGFEAAADIRGDDTVAGY